MTPDQLRQLFPRASEEFIRQNTAPVPLAVVRKAPATPASTRPTKRKPATAGKQATASRPSRVPKTRNGGTWSEARYWQSVRSALRRGFRFWKPISNALRAARISAPGPRGRKWLFLCASCQKMHLRKCVQVDHVLPCGQLTSPEHIAEFLRRLTAEEPTDFQVLCLECHQAKTDAERETVPPSS